MKIKFITLGCPKNEVDTEIMQGLLQKEGFYLVEEIDEAEVLVVNTCSFIVQAREEAIDTILEMVELKKESKIHHLLVTGCLVQAYREELKEDLPEVDAFLGTGELHLIIDRIRHIERGETLKEGPRVDFFDYNRPWPRFSGFKKQSVTAYLRIAEGCDTFCSYCVIPYLRGPYRSRSEDDILVEAKKLVERGVRELILIAQDTGLYGLDLYGERRLPHLLEKLAAISQLHWIRILYLNLEGITPRLLSTIKEYSTILPYLDIPLQHSSPSILQAMNRGENGERIEERILMIRETLPQVILRTTMIVGFPGEKEEDFLQLYTFIEKMRFERLGVFTYSREERTPSYHLSHQVPPSIKEKRRRILMELQQSISLDVNKAMIGKELEVLGEEILKRDPFLLRGRSWCDAPEIDNEVIFETKKGQIGSFYQVHINEAMEYDLLGEEIL